MVPLREVVQEAVGLQVGHTAGEEVAVQFTNLRRGQLEAAHRPQVLLSAW
jgi:hypothetical protein